MAPPHPIVYLHHPHFLRALVHMDLPTISTMVPPLQPQRVAASSGLPRSAYAQSLTDDKNSQRVTA